MLAFFVQKEDQQRVARPARASAQALPPGAGQPQPGKRHDVAQAIRGVPRADPHPGRNRSQDGGRASVLGVFEDRATAISFMSSVDTPNAADGKSLPMVVASTVALVKGKPLIFNTYFIRSSDADVAAARQAARAWLTAIELANPLLKK
ncbi:hypothetical protein LP419_16110 [Massilia sp. H-1]|nr:hypothetical protein LP419_16110 [Massilia sp. H-1]